MIQGRRWLLCLLVTGSIFYIRIDYLQLQNKLERELHLPEYVSARFILHERYLMENTGKKVGAQMLLDMLSYHVPLCAFENTDTTIREETIPAEEIIAWNETQTWKDTFMEDMEKENSIVRSERDAEKERSMSEAVSPDEVQATMQTAGKHTDTNQLFSLLKHEEIQKTYGRENLKNAEALQKRFFTIDPTTEVQEGQLDVEKLLSKNMRIEKIQEPQILIYHTHSQEAFVDSVSGDWTTSIVGAGEFLANILSEQYGYKVLHHFGEYDVESRDYAYAKAAPALEALLKEHPTIEVVIDLHRDAVEGDTKLVTNMDGIEVAQFMFFNGLSYTRERGAISYLENPYIQNHLALSFQMKLTADCYYPNLTRKIYLKGYRYNMQYCPKSLLIELGAQTNTVQEIMNACIPLAHIIDIVLSGNTPDLSE